MHRRPVADERPMSAKGYTEGVAERRAEEIMGLTEATSSGWPADSTTKQIANTDQLREAPPM